MGLLDLLLQNQSNLDINPTSQPGNGPIEPATGEFNTGANPFQQIWNSNNTYLGAFEGGTNVGIQPPTLNETGLDVDNPNFTPSTTTPNTLTAYPATAMGGLGQSAVQFLQIWSPVINYNDVVVGAPTSPLAQSLPETGLDNTDINAVDTTVSPVNPTNYPSLAKGEYNSVSNQYNTSYTPLLTYENDYINNPDKFDTLQTVTLDQTGLDNSSTFAAPTTNTFVQWDVSIPPQLPPQTYMGEFGGAPNAYWTIYTPNFNQGYLDKYDIIVSNAGNPQIHTIEWGQTGLDVENPSTITFSPNAISAPTNYPQFVQGEFNSGPTQYNQIWGPTNQYIINYNSNTQPNTVNNGETGLDNTNLLAFNTTFIPNAISSPTNYPQLPQTNLGEFGGTPSQFIPLYNPNPGQRYLDNYNNIISLAGNQQIVNLGNTGLDVENQNSAPTTYTVPYLDNITQYPVLATGEFNGASTLFTQTFTPLLTYNNLVANTPLGPYSILEQSLNQTGLDINDQNAAPTTYTVPATDDTAYPTNATGEYNGPALPYEQVYSSTPGSTYEDFVVNAVNGPASIVENSLVYTGLDVENQDAASTTYAVPEVDDTIYPYVEGATLPPKGGSTSPITLFGATLPGSIPVPTNFKQVWKPIRTYYSYMIQNFEGQVK